MKFSIIIPIFNESQNIIKLIEEIYYYLHSMNDFEVIVVDDFSSDDSVKKINSIIKLYKNLKIIINNKNMGQSFSIVEGVKNSRFDVIVTLDGDGQNNPKDILKLIKIYFDYDYKLVSGIRLKRKDNYIKKISSLLANRIRSYILNDHCKDTGCGLKIFDKKIFLSFNYFDSIHRFIPALFVATNSKVKYVNVDHRIRNYGISKYGTFDRLFYGIRDIFIVKKIIKNIKHKIK